MDKASQGVGVFRTVNEFLALTGADRPTPAELRLVKAVRAGEPCEISKVRPERGTPGNTVRARLLRLLITGATPDCGTQDFGVALSGAWIGGTLDLSFAGARGLTALIHCHFEDRPLLAQAELRELSMQGSSLPGLFAQGVRVRGSLFLRDVTATGTVDVNGAKVGGQMDCTGARLDGAGGDALNAQGVETGQSLFLRDVTATGTVAVNGAKVGGQLSCIGARLDGAGREALNAQRVETGDSFLLRGVTATGTVAVNGAKVGGQLSCTGARLDGAGGEALNAQGVETGESLFLRDVTATGTVDVNGAKVGGQMDCTGARLDGAGGQALNAQGVETGQDLFLRGVTATGTVDVNGAKVGGQLDCTGARLDGAGGKALNAQRLHVVQGLFWRGVTVTAGMVDMASAQAGDLADDGRWPAGTGMLRLDGFTYDRIAGADAPVTAAGRRGWLRCGSGGKSGRFYPQTYTQLARVLRNMGHGGEARTVLYWREGLVAAQVRRDVLAASLGPGDMAFGPLGREVRAAGLWAGSGILRVVAGYGYKPFRAFWCLCALWFAAFVMASAVWREGSFAPNSDVVLVSPGWQAALAADCFEPLPIGAHGVCDPNPANTWSSDPARGMDWESFSAIGYALDLVVPVLDLGQTDAWAPSKDRGLWGWCLWWGRWWFVAFGWIVSALGAAAVTGIMQRDRE